MTSSGALEPPCESVKMAAAELLLVTMKFAGKPQRIAFWTDMVTFHSYQVPSLET